MLLELRFLGGLSIQQNGVPLTALKSQKGQALLCYLALTGKAHSRPALAGLLWPETAEEKALMNLRHVLNQLKEHLAPHLAISRQSIGFNQNVPYWLDVADFEAGVAARSEIGPLQAAVSHYRGDFLDGFYLSDVAYFDEWVLAQRARLRELALAALHRLVTHFTAQAEYETAIDYTRQLLAIEPWREGVHRELMRLLAFCGERGAALRQYETCRRILAEELDVAPEQETVALYERIKSAASARLHNLPPQPTPFIGREEELAEIHRLLANPDCRLLTIVGVGGIGKSRLAIQAAELVANNQIRMFLHGVVFVPLAGVDSPDFLVPAIARELDLSFRGREAPEQQLLNYLRNKELLLLLDNYEHLLPGTSVLASILQEVRDVKLLVTSHQQLNLREEWLFEANGLRYPVSGPVDKALEALRSFDAVQLFEAGARRVQPGFSLAETSQEVLHICRLVDGMPLALELAASQLNAVSCTDIVKGLGSNLNTLATTYVNMPARHRSVRAAFEWSWVSLTPGEREVMGQLTVFRGGFTQEASIRVTSASQAPLASLVSKSLLRLLPSGRYNIHELLRQFVDEKLQESAERAAAHDRHLAYFLTLAEEAELHFQDSDQLLWLNHLEIEHNNLTAALQWAWEQEKAELAARLSGALGGFWGIRGYLNEGKRWLIVVLSQRQQLSAATLAQVLFASGWLAFEQGDYPQAKQFSEESLALWREVGDKPRTAKLLNRLGHVAQQQGNLAHTMSLYEESLALYQELGDKIGIALSLNRLGHLAQLQGDDKGAIGFLEESLALRRELDDKRGMASSLNAVAEIARYQGNYQRAASLYEESLNVCRQLGDKRCIAGVCHNLGHVARHQGDFGRAVALFKESLTLFQELENQGGVALCLAGLAAILGAQAQPERAAQLFGASEALLAATSTTLSPTDQQAWAQNIALVRGQLADAVFKTFYARGRVMSPEQALKYAMAEHVP